ncbi:DeoR/GlpR family DNA-binding transcription regulator [Acuticoccus sp. I52.16.1]|uniref:DeoR/GlpR family DNA-binding transcription regulator n=1 Tax=Acuticoccus sp. I52.16.1 TaxID=2928472 RepID=UPI001FD2327F|nr:DeoR/GlpR family DNA-binding transcription regulator [Acuticoccus sp. I52.16.1]UOM32918.1 DeoR/GlpR family DNA-binding transcription regulator [Acuticoccus sp. I52.16.1]
MTPDERRASIAELVMARGRQSVDHLADTFGVSAETIRRDLARLSEEGRVRKVHGGVQQAPLHAEGSFDERVAEDAPAKAAIAQRLAQIVHPGETLFVDTGSTTLAAARALAAIPGLTIVTNAHAVAAAFDARAHVYCVGGRYRADNRQTVGPIAIEDLARFQADRAVLTVAAIGREAGAADADFDEAQVARAMIAHARQTVVLATAAKFARRAAFQVCRTAEIDLLITDRRPESDLAMDMHAAGGSVLVAPAPAAGRDETPPAPRIAQPA